MIFINIKRKYYLVNISLILNQQIESYISFLYRGFQIFLFLELLQVTVFENTILWRFLTYMFKLISLQVLKDFLFHKKNFYKDSLDPEFKSLE